MTQNDMVQLFLRHRKITQKFCEIMPDEHFDFVAWDGALSFSKSALHLANSGSFYLSVAEGVPPTRVDPASLPKTPAEVRAYLAQETEEQVERIRNLGDNLELPVMMRDKEVPLWALLSQMREHEAHHKGQMMQMLRMVGVRDELFYAVR